MRRLHQQILCADWALAPESAVAPGSPVPRQLPAPPQVFTGRLAELAALDQAIDASTVVISAIDGMAGVGKTALALHAAHRIANRYPDGQLFIDLHGYTQGVEAVEAGEALDRMLRALGIPGPQVPSGLDERAALYRTRLADRRVLIVLDNAVTEAQVAPLLPGAAGCLVLVTSRRRLAGLDDADPLPLDTLPAADAVALIVRAAGEGRLAGQPPDLVAELVELCGRLPLTIRIAAARLRSHPTWNVSHLVARLRDQQHRLVELASGQRSVTGALDLSYQHLDAEQQRSYRLLGLHPGPDIDQYATAALFNSTVPQANRLLDQLLDAHLLLDPTPGRYQFHDLTRAHAAVLSRTEPSRAVALDRLLDYYQHTASAAMDAAYPYERGRRPRVSPASTQIPDLSDPAAAFDWLDTELPNLLGTARYAAEHRKSVPILHLSSTLHRHLRTRGRYYDAETLHHQALNMTLTRHQAGQLSALNGLGDIHLLQGQYQRAAGHYRQALQVGRISGDRVGELDAVNGLGDVHWVQGRYEQAADHYGQALRVARISGDRAGELDALSGLGWVHMAHGRYEQATDAYGQALQLARTTGHHAGQQAALVGLGQLHRIRGRYEEAADHYRQLLDLARETRDRNFQFEAAYGQGRLSHAAGNPDAAITQHDEALALANELGQPIDQARAHDGLAQAYHSLDRRDQARSHWRRALDILTGLGVEHTNDVETNVAAIRAHLCRLAPPA